MKGNVYAVDAETGAAGVEGPGRYAPGRAGDRRADAGRRTALRAAVVARGIGRRQSELSVLHVPRRRDVAYDAVRRQAAVDVVHRSPKRPTPLKKTSKGTQLWGPAGAGVWSSPTVDLKRRAVYVATGNAYTEPAARGSDAVDRLRPRHRQAAVDEPGDGERRLRARLPRQLPSERADGQQVRDLPRRARARHGLRQRADPADAAGRTRPDRRSGRRTDTRGRSTRTSRAPWCGAGRSGSASTAAAAR